MRKAARRALMGAFLIVAVSIGVGTARAVIEVRDFRCPCPIEKAECAVMGRPESFVCEAAGNPDNFVAAYDFVVNQRFVDIDSTVGASEPNGRINNLDAWGGLFCFALHQVLSELSGCDAHLVFVKCDDKLIKATHKTGRWLPSGILVSNQESDRISSDWGRFNGGPVWTDPRARAGNNVIASGDNALSSRVGLVLGGRSQILSDGDLCVSLAGTVRHQPELMVQSAELLSGGLMSVSQRRVKNAVGAAGEEDREDEQPYRQFFTKGSIIVVGLLLSLGAFKSISNAVDRRKVSLVGHALLLQAGGLATLLYVAGFFKPL
jgi:hypothetical protein